MCLVSGVCRGFPRYHQVLGELPITGIHLPVLPADQGVQRLDLVSGNPQRIDFKFFKILTQPLGDLGDLEDHLRELVQIGGLAAGSP